MSTDRRLAARMDRISGSGVRKMFDLIASLEDPINLSIGQADYDAPEPMKEAAARAIREGRNRYTVTQGIPELQAAVRAHLERRYGVSVGACLMTSGVSGGLLLSMMAVLDPGDEILLPDPYFVMYRNVIALAGAEARYYDLYPDEPGAGFRPKHAELADLVGPRTKAILVNSPSNPTGAMFPAEDLTRIAELARARGLWLLADEIYDFFAYDREFTSFLQVADGYDRLIVYGGLSKTWGVPGWRLGWTVGPQDVLDAMMLLQQYTYVCCPAPLQYGALAAFDLDMEEHLRAYRRKRDLVYEGLSGDYELEKPEGSFYAFPAYPAGWNEKDFVAACLERRLLIVPGSAFSRRASHFRLSFAAPDEKLAEGVEILRELARRKR